MYAQQRRFLKTDRLKANKRITKSTHIVWHGIVYAIYVYAHSGRFTRLAVIVTVVMLPVAEQQQDIQKYTVYTIPSDQHVYNTHEI